jgi:hypothetical protein
MVDVVTKHHFNYISVNLRLSIGIASVSCIVYLFMTTKDYSNLYSLFGLLGFILIATFLSKYPSKV